MRRHSLPRGVTPRRGLPPRAPGPDSPGPPSRPSTPTPWTGAPSIRPMEQTMNDESSVFTGRHLSGACGTRRRAVILGGAGALGATSSGRGRPSGALRRCRRSHAAAAPGTPKTVHLAGTDGWGQHAGRLARRPALLPGLAGPAWLRHVRLRLPRRHGDDSDRRSRRSAGKAQISAPMLAFDEGDDITITLTNLGLLQRPDLFDGHTLHWHGFVNAIPLFDGVPELSLVGADRARPVLLLPAPRRRDVHVPLPLRGRRARADGHDRDGLRAAEAERHARRHGSRRHV